jgi:hypothetical protein
MVHLQALLVQLEPILVLLAAVIFFKSGSARRFPAMGVYLAVRGGSTLLLEALLWHWSPSFTPNLRYTLYFYTYWVTYIASAVAIFFVIQEIFRHVMEPVPGLRRLGLLAFRWVSIVSVVVTVGAIALPASIAAPNGNRIGPIALQLMRCVSVMEICLLAFLALSTHALGRTFRSRFFGIGLGFGIEAAAELFFTALSVRFPGLTSSANLFAECATLLMLLTWTVYFLLPEPQVERERVVLAPNSSLARWNSLANGLGQMPQVATAQSSTGFFLQDIEGVVERVLAKNPVINGGR